MKIAVYTANIGGCIKFYEPQILENNVDYIYFTDDKNLKQLIRNINRRTRITLI